MDPLSYRHRKCINFSNFERLSLCTGRSAWGPLFAIVACFRSRSPCSFAHRTCRSLYHPLFAILACLRIRSSGSFAHRTFSSLHPPLAALTYGSTGRARFRFLSYRHRKLVTVFNCSGRQASSVTASPCHLPQGEGNAAPYNVHQRTLKTA